MPLRNGKKYLKNSFKLENQPFKLINLSEKKYHVNIDFDYSSKQWRKNKISLGEGMFQYIR